MRGKKDFQLKSKRPKSSLKKTLSLALLTPLLILIGLFIIGAIAEGGKAAETNTKQVVAPTQQQKMGATVSDAGFDFVVNSLKCGETHISTGGTVYYYSDAQGQYCRLNVTVTNIGNSANNIIAYDQHVYDSQGKQYTYASDATASAAGDVVGTPLNDDINPGNSVTGDIVFDVPVGVTPTTAELHGNYDSRGVKVDLQ